MSSQPNGGQSSTAEARAPPARRRRGRGRRRARGPRRGRRAGRRAGALTPARPRRPPTRTRPSRFSAVRRRAATACRPRGAQQRRRRVGAGLDAERVVVAGEAGGVHADAVGQAAAGELEAHASRHRRGRAVACEPERARRAACRGGAPGGEADRLGEQLRAVRGRRRSRLATIEVLGRRAEAVGPGGVDEAAEQRLDAGAAAAVRRRASSVLGGLARRAARSRGRARPAGGPRSGSGPSLATWTSTPPRPSSVIQTATGASARRRWW